MIVTTAFCIFTMRAPYLVANIEAEDKGSAIVTFHDIETCMEESAGLIAGYRHVSPVAPLRDVEQIKTSTKGHKLAQRASTILNTPNKSFVRLETSGDGIVGGSPCEGNTRLVEGIKWFEKTTFKFPTASSLSESASYLQFSSSLAQIAPEDFLKSEVTLVTGMCLFAMPIIHASMPAGQPLNPAVLEVAGPTLYEIDHIARSVPAIADFAALKQASEATEQSSRASAYDDLIIDIPAFHYYQSIESRLLDAHTTFAEAIRWLDAVKLRQCQIADIFMHHLDSELTKRGVDPSKFRVRVSPLTDLVFSYIRSSLEDSVLPNIEEVLVILALKSSTWTKFFQLLSEKERPTDFKSLSYLFYVFQVVRLGIAANEHHIFSADASAATVKPPKPRLIIGIDDGMERRVYTRATKFFKTMKKSTIEYPISFNLLEIYMARRFYINGNRLGSHVYLDDPLSKRPQMGTYSCQEQARAETASDGERCPAKLDAFDLVNRVHGSGIGSRLRDLFRDVGLCS